MYEMASHRSYRAEELGNSFLVMASVLLVFGMRTGLLTVLSHRNVLSVQMFTFG